MPPRDKLKIGLRQLFVAVGLLGVVFAGAAYYLTPWGRAVLTITCDAPGAEIVCDGNSLGPAPVRLSQWQIGAMEQEVPFRAYSDPTVIFWARPTARLAREFRVTKGLQGAWLMPGADHGWREPGRIHVALTPRHEGVEGARVDVIKGPARPGEAVRLRVLLPADPSHTPFLLSSDMTTITGLKHDEIICDICFWRVNANSVETRSATPVAFGVAKGGRMFVDFEFPGPNAPGNYEGDPFISFHGMFLSNDVMHFEVKE